jgi:uncharacterized integral membrane protein
MTNSKLDPEPFGTESASSSETPTGVAPRTSSERGGMRTRTSTVWTAVVVLVASLVLVLVFILQNLQAVAVSFLVFHGRLPLGVALLVAATLGGVIVVAAGAARLVQLRRARRRTESIEPVGGSAARDH